MPFTFTDATAPVKAGVCDDGHGLHHDIQAGFSYDCPWYKSCARENGMIQVIKVASALALHHAVTLRGPRGHRDNNPIIQERLRYRYKCIVHNIESKIDNLLFCLELFTAPRFVLVLCLHGVCESRVRKGEPGQGNNSPSASYPFPCRPSL